LECCSTAGWEGWTTPELSFRKKERSKARKGGEEPMYEVDTIRDSAKKAIVDLLNKSLQFEYAFIINYPRIIDKLVAMDEIHDEQVTRDLEYLGKSSVQHVGWVGQLILELGGKPAWRIDTIDRMVDVGSMLVQQLAKEKAAQSVYQEARRIAEKNQVKTKVRDVLGEFTKMRDEADDDVIRASDVISVLERLASEEQTHIRLAEDTIATLKMLTGK